MDISRFLNVYASLPDRLKDQLVIVIDEKPMSWNAVYFELKSDTELAQRIMDQLIEMDII
jgi:hypothetical protein